MALAGETRLHARVASEAPRPTGTSRPGGLSYREKRFMKHPQLFPIKCAVQNFILIADLEILIIHFREVNVELILIQQFHQQCALLFYVPDGDEICHRVFGNLGIDIPIQERLSCHLAPELHEFVAGARRLNARNKNGVVGHQFTRKKICFDKSLLREDLFKPLCADSDMLFQLLDEDKLPFAPPLHIY